MAAVCALRSACASSWAVSAQPSCAASLERTALAPVCLQHRASPGIGRQLGLPLRRKEARWLQNHQERPVRTVAAQSGETGVTSSTSTAPKSKEIVPDSEFNIAKISFGTIGVFLGVGLLSFGFGSYFQLTPGGDFSALLLTYGFPCFLIGCALKYAELKPVPLISYADAVALRESQATPILEQVRNDVTRYRYGDEQHLDEALKRIFRYGQGGGISRRDAPVLTAIREEVENGRYTLTLIFTSKLTKQQWEEKQAKFSSFFGPGVTADIVEAGNDTFEVKLVANGGSK